MSTFSERGWREYHSRPSYGSMLLSSIPRRYVRLAASLISAAVLCSYTRTLDWQPSSTCGTSATEANTTFPPVREPSENNTLPPLYEAYRDYEDQISAYNIESQNITAARYIYFANHAYGCGWGNVLQDMVFNSLLASEANLGFVWNDYTWSKTGEYSDFKGKLIPSKIPISTMLSGHILGHHSQNSSKFIPRSISRSAYEVLCPPHLRTIINRELIKSHLHERKPTADLEWSSGEEILRAWTSYLRTPKLMGSQCIEVEKDTPMPFDIWLFGSARIQTLWPRLSRSPVLTQWHWSPLILNAFKKNIEMFAPEEDILRYTRGGLYGLFWNYFTSLHNWRPSLKARHSKDSPSPPRNASHTPSRDSSPKPSTSFSANLPPNSYLLHDFTPLPILVLHLRRGDFIEHCSNLAGWKSTFTGFNSFPEFYRDHFDVPCIESINSMSSQNQTCSDIDAGGPVVSSKEESDRIYAQHCLPDVVQIVRKVRAVLHDYEDALWENGGRESSPSLSWWKQWNSPRASTHLRKSIAHKNLKKLYIMTNGDSTWLAEVKHALIDDAAQSIMLEGDWDFSWKWQSISTSRDLQLGWEEKPVSQALDTYVAHRAEIFIGNGFSSLTSNIVVLRKRNSMIEPIQTRFW